MIAENLLREPDNPKFRQFKPTNMIIKRDLVGPKGALEYAVAVRRTPLFAIAPLIISIYFFPLSFSFSRRWVSVPRFDYFFLPLFVLRCGL